MKNKNGFVMAEALIVSAVVLTTLVLIYAQFAKINKYYGDSYYYDNVNDIYALDKIFSYLEDESILSIYNNLSTYLDITDCNLSYYTNKEYCTKLFHYANLSKLYITLNDTEQTYSSMSSINDISVRLLNYIKTLDDSDTEYSYRLIAEFNDGTYASIPVGSASIMLGSTWFDEILNDGITKDSIVSITTQDYIHYNGTYNKVYDVSVQHNDKVRAYLIETETAGKYNIVLAATNGVYANPDSSELFKNFQYLDRIDLSHMNTSKVTNMYGMFYSPIYSSTIFSIELGDNFDTSNVTNMGRMFRGVGSSNTSFTLDLGEKFDTSKVTNMSYMFYNTGRNSTVFTLDLSSFDTSKVTNMSNMFYATGYSNQGFTLDLGEKFDTSQVTNMSYMFYNTGRNSTVFTLDLGEKFDTSKVKNMSNMFNSMGYKSRSFTLNLGNKFDTSKVEDMSNMFYAIGYSNTKFTLDLGDKFDTSKVEDMSYMFYAAGHSSTKFTLDLGDKFDTSIVTNMSNMFYATGYSSSTLTLDLGDKFITSNVTNMENMFHQIGRLTNDLVIDISQFSFVSNPTIVNFFGENRTNLVTFYVKDQAAVDYLTPAVINNVTVSIKP